MKKLFLLLLVSTFLISCSSDSSSDNSGPNLSNTPLAKAEFDNSNLGIYKGVFTGSSGIITVNIKNNEGNINAILVLDNVTYTFASTESISNTGDISDLTFISGAMSFDLSISNNGENITVSAMNFPNHPTATISIVKEYSNMQVKCYQGTFTGTSSGVLNVITIDNSVYGLAYPNEAEDASYLSGIINGTALTGTYGSDPVQGNFSGAISGNTITGAWESIDTQNPGSGNWTAQRTL
jgi:hypothetical protein